MNIAQAFATYLEGLGIATLGQDLIIGRAPNSNEVSDNLWWILANGGSPIKKNDTGESMKRYMVSVYYRNTNYKVIEDALFNLENSINCDGCSQLSGFDTIDLEATTFPIDQDLDSEDRMVGLLQATITTYKECT
jgi:hypothetical protein